MAEPSNPHDALFKTAFSDLDEARSLLRSQLPSAVAARVDWSTLRLEPGSFVDRTLRSRHTDLLFTARVDGEAGFIYVLLEHQSTPDAWMPYRLVCYQVRIWEAWRADNPDASHLPVIIPIVLFHGARSWSAPRELRTLFEVSDELAEALGPALLSQAFLLDDLSEVTDAQLDARALSTFSSLTLRALARTRQLAPQQVLPELMRWLKLARRLARAPTGLHKLGALLHYLVKVADVPEADLRVFAGALQAPQEGDDTVTTLADRWMAQGMEKGIEKGREQGRAALLILLLELKFSSLPADTHQRVFEAAPADIDRWSERLLDAPNLDAVFEA